MSVPVALDTTILSDIAAARTPESKIEDRKAIDALLNLAREGVLELGIALTGAAMEQRLAGQRKRQVLKSRLDGLLHIWPVTVTSAHHAEIDKQKACLKTIMQDRNGSDSEIFLVSTLHSQYFLTTDYRYCRRFRQQEGCIRKRCGITAHVLTPCEFLAKYESGTI
jgi:hypothetical protein